MKSILAMTLLCLLMQSIVSAQEQAAFTSKVFSAQITRYGGIENLKVGQHVLLRKLFLYSNYVLEPDDEKHDARLFQSMDMTPCKITRPDAKTMVIQKQQATLGNKHYPRALVYDQKITLTPTTMTVEYDVKTAVSLDSNMNLFMTLMELPLTLCGHGYQAHALNGKHTMAVIPQSYSPDNPLRIMVDRLLIAVDGGVLKLECPSESQMSFYDGRAWKADHLRLDVSPRTLWQAKPVTYRAGSEFHWSFTLTFVPLDED